MSPTPADITDAIMLLQSLPGTRGTDTLDQIEFANSPRGRMARTLISWINNPNIDLATFTAKDMADTLNKFAATQGLYITSDPAPSIDDDASQLDADLVELDALPDGSTVLDREGIAWQRWTYEGSQEARWWAHAPRLMAASGTWSEGSGKWTSAALIVQRGPVLIIHTADGGQS